MARSISGRNLRVGIISPLEPCRYCGIVDQTDRITKIIDLLQSRLNFTYTLVTVPDQPDDGTSFIRGRWSTLIRMLERDEVDIIAEPVPFLPNIQETIDTSITLGQEEWVTLQNQPSHWNSPSALLAPFEMKVWLLVILSMVCMIPSMFIMYVLYLKFHPKVARLYSSRISDYILFVIVSLLRQDHKLRIPFHSQRVLMATWWIAGLLLMTFYTANLTASLARPFRERFIQNPRELYWLGYKDVKWLMLKNGFYQVLIQNSDASFGSFTKDLLSGRGKLVESVDVAINLTRHGYIWFGPFELLQEVLFRDYRLQQVKNITTKELCSFALTDKSYLTVSYGMAFPKNSTLTSLFNQELRLIDQSGMLEFTRRPSFKGKKGPCSTEGSYAARSMKLGDFFGLFCVTIVGLSLATIAFLGEKLSFQLRKLWRQRKTTPKEVTPFPTTDKELMTVNRNVLDGPSCQLELEIERLTQEIDNMLLSEKEFREILQEFLYVK